MTTVLYTSPYIPGEWIAAHGLEPVRVMPARAKGAPAALDRQGVCPFVRRLVASVQVYPGTAAIVMTTTCDQMRRAFDVVTRTGDRPAFLLNVPSTWQSVTARRLYREELDRLSAFLVRIGGVRPSEKQLAESMLACGDAPQALYDGSANASLSRTPVALVGGPLCQEDLAVFGLIEASGGYVALDATENGLCGRRLPFDRRRVRAEPLSELADAYLDGIRDIGRRPNDEFYVWLLRELAEAGIRGIIVYRHLWCDLWHAEIERLRARTGLSVLDLDSDDTERIDSGRNRTRIGAFLEMLT